ncbi:MAG TPA: universal stress protein [Gemmatimonadales bacterium]|jgi:nucleotide-binding universal stress UspA family protein
MFTRLLVGLDGSPHADAALEQAVLLGRRFHSLIIVAAVAEADKGGPEAAAALVDRGRFRVAAAGLEVEGQQQHGDPDVALGELAKDVDAVLVGRRGVETERAGPDALGRTAASLIRLSERTVIVCGGGLSPMQVCAVAFDGRNRRALDLAARFASVAGSTVHVIHACVDRADGMRILGQAEAELSLLGVPFRTHLEEGSAGDVVGRVVREIRADALFAGAHVPRGPMERRASVASHTEDILLHTDLPVAIQP